MKKILALAVAGITSFGLYAQITAPSWLTAIGTGGGFYENGGGIRAGYGNGKIYMNYRYAGNINLNGASPVAAGGGTACGAAQLTSNLSGAGQWATREQSSGGYDYVFGFNIDVNNNTYTVGTVNSGGSLLVSKTNSTGTLAWTLNLGTAYGVGADGVCADAAGNVYVAGSISSSQTIGGFPLVYQGGGDDMALIKLNSAGTVVWAIDYGGAGDEESRAIELDQNGNPWVIGGYTGSPTFGSFTAPAAGSYSNLFVAEFNAGTGACMNMFTAVNAGIGSGHWYEESDMRIDSCNNIYVAGHFQNTATWGSFTATSVGQQDMYVAKINPNGVWQWVVTGGSPNTDEASGIALDKNWDVLVGGYFSGTMTIGSTSITATGNNDAFVAKLASGNGALMFVQKGGGVGYEDDYGGLTADDNRQVYLTGGFSDNNIAANTTQFGSSNLGNGYYGDIYVAKLDSTPNLRIYPQPQPSYCSGGCYTLPFTTVGTFNGGNVFTVQLSDATGSFATGTTTLGTVNSTTSSSISFCIPSSVTAGSNYNIRIVSSSPAYSSVVRCSSITINGPPAVTVSSGVSICAGGSTTLTAGGASTYNWTPSATLSPSTGTTVTATPTVTTTYSVIGTDANGCTDTASTTVTISNTAIASISGNTTICSGDSTTLTASGGGNYQWSSGGTSANETFTPPSTTTYSVVVSDPVSGCSDTATATITVNPAPTAAISGNTSVCNGSSVTLTATGGGNYQWSSGGTSANETVSPTTTTTYTVQVSDPVSGCGDSATTTITVNAVPVVSISGNNAICSGNSTTLTATGGGNYQWSSGGTSANETVTPTSTTTFTVVVTDPLTSCSDSATTTVTVNSLPVVNISGNTTLCSGSSTTLTATGGGNYQWSSGGTSANETITPASSGSYTVVVTDPVSTCSDSATVSVTVNPVPTAAISGATTICSGSSATLTASGGGNYQWSSGGTSATETVTPATTTTYTVTVTNASGCSDTATATVVVNPSPVASITGVNQICTGQSVTLSASGAGNYSWSTGGTGSSITDSPSATTTYSLTVTDPVTGCSDNATFTVTVSNPPTASISGATSVCAGSPVTLTAAGGGTYSWNTGQTSSTITVSSVVNTTYTVVVSNGACTDTATFNLNVNPLPAVNAGTDTTINYGTSITLNAVTGVGNTVSWSPSAGLSCTSCTDPIASPASATTYCVVATTAAGCSDTSCITIYVDIVCGDVFVPSAFSPNNDGMNDVLKVNGNCITNMDFQVFDRWGEKVFETTDPDQGWDGTFRGKQMDDGVFVYQLTGILVNGNAIQKKGNVSIIR